MGIIFKTKKRIRLGIWGLGRGHDFMQQCQSLNVDVVAGCDFNETIRNDFQKACPDVFVTADEDEFLAQDIDAVLVATWFEAHAEHAIKALKAGKHVMSEVTAFFTPAEGVSLAEAAEASGKIYFLAENYPWTKHNLFIRKLWREGLFGELVYAEYNYVHECRTLCYSYIVGKPVQPGNTAHNWRSWLNFHYYCTHSLGPVMQITGTRPVTVSAPPSKLMLAGYLPGSEMGSMEPSLIVMDNGGLVRNLTGAGTADSHERRIWGTRAYVDLSSNEPEVVVGQSGHGHRLKLHAEWPSWAEHAEKGGHGGGDFWDVYYFADAILNGTAPPWDIYKACDVTLTGIMAVKSQLQGGVPVEVPDFRKKEVRDQYRNDHFCQQHFDPKKIFPEDQEPELTGEFSSIMCSFDPFCGKHDGTVLVNAAFDGMKLYPYLADDTARMQVVSDVRSLLKRLPDLKILYEKAKRLADAYPDSMASKALRSYYESTYPEKIFHPDTTRQELLDWLENGK